MNTVNAPVAELADALDSGSSRGDSVQVRFLSGAPRRSKQVFASTFFIKLYSKAKGIKEYEEPFGSFLFA